MQRTYAVALCLWVLLLHGCAKGPESETATTPAKGPEPGHAHVDGEHGGVLVELGDDEYHAEVVLEKPDAVVVYLFDGEARGPAFSEAKTLVVNVRTETTGRQYPCAADPAEGDPAGKTSRFISTDVTLAKALGEHDADWHLRIDIAGNSYTGRPEHSHQHAEHRHERDDEHEHEK